MKRLPAKAGAFHAFFWGGIAPGREQDESGRKRRNNRTKDKGVKVKAGTYPAGAGRADDDP